MSTYEELQKARRKVNKWQRRADKAKSGTERQSAVIKLRKWQGLEEFWFEEWQKE